MAVHQIRGSMKGVYVGADPTLRCGQRQRIKVRVRMEREGKKLARGKSPSLVCPLFLDVTLQIL